VFEPEAPITPTAVTTYRSNDPYPRQSDFPSIAETNSPNTQGWWEVRILDPGGVELTKGLVNFGGDGTLNASTDSDGEINISLENIDWFNGSAIQDIDIDVSRFSQFSGNYDVIFSDQNGAELGLRTGVEITRDGTVVARFSNGASADLYRVPLTTFANANGLTEVSGTAYTESEESGEENLREAGTGGAGFVEPSTLEASNVDLADEFARLIVSQRAFGAGTRTINTVDQMTQDLLSLRG
jgi:flagellar hook protein FlgE